MGQRPQDPVRVGVITGVRGIKGEVRIKSFTEVPEDVAAYGPVFDRTGERRFDLRVVGVQKGLVVARIKGVGDRNAAEALKRTELFIGRDQLPPPEEDEYYLADLEGLRAATVAGDDLGIVRGAYDFGAGAVLELDGGIMVPFNRDVVSEVDMEGGRLVIDPPEGLLEPATQDDGRDDADSNVDGDIKDETT